MKEKSWTEDKQIKPGGKGLSADFCYKSVIPGNVNKYTKGTT